MILKRSEGEVIMSKKSRMMVGMVLLAAVVLGPMIVCADLPRQSYLL